MKVVFYERGRCLRLMSAVAEALTALRQIRERQRRALKRAAA